MRFFFFLDGSCCDEYRELTVALTKKNWLNFDRANQYSKNLVLHTIEFEERKHTKTIENIYTLEENITF